jgi:molecular chaperone GrpE
MDEDKRVSSEAPGEPAKQNAEAENAAGGANGAQDIEALVAENQALKAQGEELNDRNLRLVAEMENLRRRTERDKSEFAKYAISEFARDMLNVGDNLRRALEALPKETVISDPAVTSLLEGVEVTERELLKVLERFQVKRFDPLGEPFNPHLHEAMTKVDVPNVPADTVIQTIHAGFMIGDRVLRPAAVIVAKGGGQVEQAQQRTSESEGAVPPGAMRVPEDAVSSSPRQGGGSGQGGQGNPENRGGGRPHQDGDPQQSWASDERVAPFRRAPRQAGQGGQQGPGPGHDPRQQQQPQQPQNGNHNRDRTSSPLHKPVIGNQDW